MLVSLFISAKPHINQEQDLALLKAQQLLKQNVQVQQILFYQQGVLHAKSPHAVIWKQLFPNTSLMVCSQYAEQYQINQPEGFHLQGLVDFFAKHWQSQSQIIQI